MRFKDIVIDNVDLNGENDGNFEIYATDELVEITNKIRERQGNLDLVKCELDNDVYYNFYLLFDIDKKEVKLQSACNHGENDDYVWYDIELLQEEKEMFMFKIINYFTNFILDNN